MSTSLRIDTEEHIAGALVIGATGLGLLGSSFPATGTHGPGYAYDSVVLQPSFAQKEYRATLDAVPAGVVISAAEDSSFTTSGPDGTHVVSWSLYEDGQLIGSTQFTLAFGTSNAVTSTVNVR